MVHLFLGKLYNSLLPPINDLVVKWGIQMN